MKELPIMVRGGAIADASGLIAAGPDACLLLDAASIARGGLPILLASGPAARHDPRAVHAAAIDRPDAVILPGLVNAHTHLDLTHIGPQPYTPSDGFVSWINMVRTRRETTDAGIAAAVRRGVKLSLAGGTVAVGDIAGAPAGRPSLVPFETLRSSPLLGVSFLEFFAIGAGMEGGIRAAEESLRRALALPPLGMARLGLQPHAPNTVGLAAYRWAVEQARISNLPLSTHLAETAEEREFIATASGPQREFLGRIGLWDDSLLDDIGRGRTPIEHLRDVLGAAPFAVAHVNDADDEGIGALANSRQPPTVVYCPRASTYFGAPDRLGPHRYRDMLAAGIQVALGTDSIINLDTPDRISVLDEMRFLYQRDATDPILLLRMGTFHGAGALHLEPGLFSLRADVEHPIAGLTSVKVEDLSKDPLIQVFIGTAPAELLLGRNHCCETRME